MKSKLYRRIYLDHSAYSYRMVSSVFDSGKEWCKRLTISDWKDDIEDYQNMNPFLRFLYWLFDWDNIRDKLKSEPKINYFLTLYSKPIKTKSILTEQLDYKFLKLNKTENPDNDKNLNRVDSPAINNNATFSENSEQLVHSQPINSAIIENSARPTSDSSLNEDPTHEASNPMSTAPSAQERLNEANRDFYRSLYIYCQGVSAIIRDTNQRLQTLENQLQRTGRNRNRLFPASGIENISPNPMRTAISQSVAPQLNPEEQKSSLRQDSSFPYQVSESIQQCFLKPEKQLADEHETSEQKNTPSISFSNID